MQDKNETLEMPLAEVGENALTIQNDASPEVTRRAANIRLVILDVDGVLTDGSLCFDNHGNEYKSFYSRDGYGMKALMQTGVQIGIITGRESQVVANRAAELGVPYLYQGYLDKNLAFEDLLARTGLQEMQAAYVGDDVVDLPVMERVHLAVAVADAHPLVKRRAHWCTPSIGGRGAVRDICELIMLAQGTLVPVFGVSSG